MNFVATTVILALQAGAGGSADHCRAAQAIAPGFPACVTTPHGLALAGSQADAERMARHSGDAEARFEAAFGQPVMPYVVLDTSAPAPVAALRASGYRTILRWPTPAAFAAAARAGFERAARQFAASQNMGPADTEALVARAFAQRQARIGDVQDALDAGMIPHELGHHWFTETFWPDAMAPNEAERPRHYGGPAPDWLEETAAVMMEDAPTADRRRAQFAALLRGEPLPSIGRGVSRETLLDLRHFLSREHPAFARTMASPPPMQPGGGVGVMFRPAGAAGNASPGATDEVLFYLQARRFADFLIETSGRADILAAIAKFVAAGGSIEGWLRTEAAGHGLPTRVEALDAAWRTWADASVRSARPA